MLLSPLLLYTSGGPRGERVSCIHLQASHRLIVHQGPQLPKFIGRFDSRLPSSSWIHTPFLLREPRQAPSGSPLKVPGLTSLYTAMCVLVSSRFVALSALGWAYGFPRHHMCRKVLSASTRIASAHARHIMRAAQLGGAPILVNIRTCYAVKG